MMDDEYCEVDIVVRQLFLTCGSLGCYVRYEFEGKIIEDLLFYRSLTQHC
jgi:hypothetical protein